CTGKAVKLKERRLLVREVNRPLDPFHVRRVEIHLRGRLILPGAIVDVLPDSKSSTLPLDGPAHLEWRNLTADARVSFRRPTRILRTDEKVGLGRTDSRDANRRVNLVYG